MDIHPISIQSILKFICYLCSLSRRCEKFFDRKEFTYLLGAHDDGVFNECKINDQESDDDIASIDSKDNDDDDADDDDD